MTDGIEHERVSVQSAILIFAAGALALSVHQNNGMQSPPAILLLAISCLATLAALFARRSTIPWEAVEWLLFLMILAEVASVTEGIFRLPFTGVGPSQLSLLCAMTVAAGALAALVIFAKERISKFAFVLLTVVVLGMGAWVLRFMPVPPIDVFIFQNDSIAALLNGRNPYAITFPDPYSPDASAAYYGPGVSVDGRLMFGYPYTPLPLLLTVPGYLLGDVRYVEWASMLATAILIALAGRDRLHRGIAAMLLVTPQMPHVLSQSWVEPISLMLLAWVYYCSRRWAKALPYVVAMLLVSKQYMAVVLPLAWLASGQPWTRERLQRFAVPFVVTAAVLTLPLMLWDWGAFTQSAVLLQIRQPYRHDSLSFLAWAMPQNPNAWLWLPFAMAVGALGLVFWRTRSDRVSFSLAFSLVLLLFFAFNKQAFANYYYLVIGGLCIAASEAAGLVEATDTKARGRVSTLEPQPRT
jgi:hypothetical protein